jgi:hypothetical protein
MPHTLLHMHVPLLLLKSDCRLVIEEVLLQLLLLLLLLPEHWRGQSDALHCTPQVCHTVDFRSHCLKFRHLQQVRVCETHVVKLQRRNDFELSMLCSVVFVQGLSSHSNLVLLV